MTDKYPLPEKPSVGRKRLLVEAANGYQRETTMTIKRLREDGEILSILARLLQKEENQGLVEALKQAALQPDVPGIDSRLLVQWLAACKPVI